MTPDELMTQMLAVLRNQFYADSTEKEFFQERSRLMQAITQPAAWLEMRAARLSCSRYRSILLGIIDTIKTKGNTAKIDCFSVYFLHCVQAHMQHQGDRYYEEAKTPRKLDGMVAKTIKSIRGMHHAAPGDNTVSILAAVHATLKTRGGRKKKTSNPSASVQLDFLGGAQPLQGRDNR